ncbi:MAG: SOS response-associated peptidase [Cryomorphaceae bacterium]|nr:SOS response-associated peptidase [Flavobacteriales bacterium]
MCGRYVVISKIVEIEDRFNVKSVGPFSPNYNIGPGSKAPVITDKEPGKLNFFQFGLTPFWAKKKMYFFNARAEGDQNKENDPLYKGGMGIVKKPAFRKAIRSQRCLVIADCFIEGTTKEKLDKPHVVHLGKGERPFAFAGIWDEWVDKETGEILQSFAIITTTPNDVLQRIPHHRSPVILPKEMERKWLDTSLPLSEVTAMLAPWERSGMNAYPISTDIKNPRNNNPDLLKPTGEPICKTADLKLEQNLVLEGMGYSHARQRKD